MEGYSTNDTCCRQFLDLMEKERDSAAAVEAVTPSEEGKLELRLGPPGGGGDWSIKNKSKASRETDRDYVSSYGFFSSSQISSILKPPPCPEKTRACSFHLESHNSESKQVVHLKESSSQQPCLEERHNQENKLLQSDPANTAVPNSCSPQKRSSSAQVVGWPPIRSFRKNNGSGSSSKLATQSADEALVEGSKPTVRNLFVKINMEGVPIGRKIDISAYDNYEKLSKDVDELFRDLLPAQCNGCTEIKGGENGRMMSRRILDETREYTLVYEDNEGDRMLVGDLPWPMFASTVKRLRVLKTTELPMQMDDSRARKLNEISK